MKAAVLGSPIAHSLSPDLHRAAYLALGLTGWTYRAIECDEAALPGLLASCGPDWAGLSLTMPLKRAVLPLLDHIEPLAAEVGAANTVVFAAGRRHGHNTDVPGLLAALAERGIPGTSLPPHPAVLILGAGATACSALAALRALDITQVTVAARAPARAGDLLATADRLGTKITLTPFDTPRVRPDLLISTVPAGAADPYAQRIAARTFLP
ncbi:MAG: shikimate dehydrogenase family protein, partial [Streptosporangiales bacterium]